MKQIQTIAQVSPQKFADRLAVLVILALVVGLAAAVRLPLALRQNFPLNDGGLFFQMTRDLQANGYRLPAYTTYNFRNIPFAYPPLPFYFSGLLSDLTGIDLIELFRFLPLAFNLLTVLAVYLLAREWLADQMSALQAALIFGLLLPGYEWQIMGGGVTRSPAYFFSVLALYFTLRALKAAPADRAARLRAWLPAWLLLWLTGVSHLQIFYITAIWVVVIVLYHTRSWRSLAVLAGLFAAVGLALAPYGLAVINRHGLQPFLAAFSTGHYRQWLGLILIPFSNLTGEMRMTPVFIFAVLGILRRAYRKDYLFVWLLLASAVLDPRGLTRDLAILFSLAAADAIFQLALPAVSGAPARHTLPAGAAGGAAPDDPGELMPQVKPPSTAPVMAVILYLLFASALVTRFLADSETHVFK
ncbi:MAG: hypothetical protein ACKOC5_00215, partial [Chloroflexota bacterium]